MNQCSSTYLSSWNPWYTFTFVMEPQLTKLLTQITCKKIKYSVIRHFNSYYRSQRARNL